MTGLESCVKRVHKLPIVLTVAALLVIVVAPARFASAHPMGNFSINHYANLRVENGGLLIRYRLDLAEIPTAQQLPSLEGKISDAERAAYLAKELPALSAGLEVRLDGKPAALIIERSDLEVRPGAADLPTLLLTIDYRVALSGSQCAPGARVAIWYRDGNFPDATGWREIVAKPSASAQLVEADVPRNERSMALESYPQNPTEAPPQEREARVVVRIGALEARTTASEPANSPSSSLAPRNSATPQDRFTQLIATRQLSGAVLLLSLGIAFGLGCFHALSPGHGKTVVAAYLVGARGTARHAALLGLVVTLTHVAGVFLLGLTVLFASKYVLPERLYPWLGFGSGLMIVLLGVWQFGRRYAIHYLRSRGLEIPRASDPHGPGGHTHELPERITAGGLIALGISGGIVPCPSALIVMLSAIALHRTAFGLVLIVSFSAGLASVLIAIGLLMLYARQLADRLQWGSGIMQRLPLASPLIVAVLGALITAQAIVAGRLL